MPRCFHRGFRFHSISNQPLDAFRTGLTADRQAFRGRPNPEEGVRVVALPQLPPAEKKILLNRPRWAREAGGPRVPSRCRSEISSPAASEWLSCFHSKRQPGKAGQFLLSDLQEVLRKKLIIKELELDSGEQNPQAVLRYEW